jgi:hypothetical protein
MSEHESRSQQDDRGYFEIDFDKEPAAWIKAHSRLGREMGHSFLEEHAEQLQIADGEYTQPFVWNETGESLQPSSLITRYTTDLLDKGVEQVNLLDFGAGAAVTMSQAALQMEELINQGKVRMIATNWMGIPSVTDMDELKRREGNPQVSPYDATKEAIEKGLVTFQEADIVEVSERIRTTPVHLVFLVDVLPHTTMYNDFLLNQSGKLLDPQHGTLVLGHGNMRMNVRNRREKDPWTILHKGVDSLTERGFEQRPSGLIQPSGDRLFTTFQAPHAPRFQASIANKF